MTEEKKPVGDNGKLKTSEQIAQEKRDAQKPPVEIKKGEQKGQSLPPKDFKIAEIWIKNDTVALDACPNFWMDKLRAIGILEYCKEIVKEYNPTQKRKIITGSAVSQVMNKIGRIKNRIGGAFGGKK